MRRRAATHNPLLNWFQIREHWFTHFFFEKSVAELLYKSKADLAACLVLAFPEQFIAVSSTE